MKLFWLKPILILLNNPQSKANKEELLNAWMIKYAEKLKPELEIGIFRFLKEEDFVNWKRLPRAF